MRRALERDMLATHAGTDSFQRRGPRWDVAQTAYRQSPKVRGKKEGWPWRKARLARCQKRRRMMPFLTTC